MTTRTCATLDANAVGPLLLLDPSNAQFSTIDTCDASRAVFGTLPALSGQYAYEAYIWSESRGNLAGLVSVGVAQPSSSLSARVGAQSTSFGFLPADGKIYNNNAAIATVPTVAERIALGVHLSLGPSSCTCDFLVNGSVTYTATLPTGKAWVPAISLGATSPGDIKAWTNFGQHRFDKLPWPNGWSQQTSGLRTFYLSVATEAFMSSNADAPANQSFAPHILNSKQICIRRQPSAWFHRTGGRTNPAALTTIQVDNSTGAFNDLLRADARDSIVVYQMIDAPAGGAGSLATATTMFTGILDKVSAPNSSTVEITLRDTLARFDKPMPMRVVPPFYNEASAGKVVPVGLGAQRNVQPLLLDEPNRIYLLGDDKMSNVTQVSDMAAPLDPLALPPQWTSALDGAGIQLQTDPVGRVAVDCSSVGAQYEIPGAQDVLNGDGQFLTWPGVPGPITTTPPNHFDWSGYAGSTLMKFVGPAYAPTKTSARIISSRRWSPTVPIGSPPVPWYGDYLKTNTQPLLGGRSYRLTFKLPTVYAPAPLGSGKQGGLMIRTALSNDPADAVSAHGIAITSATGPRDNYVIDFRVPVGAARDLYFLAVASGGNTAGSITGPGGAEIYDVNIELLGQYQSAPMDGIGIQSALNEILVRRCGEDASVFSQSDTLALDAVIGYQCGFRYEDTPNVLDVLTEIADQYAAILFTDEFGQIRVRTTLSVGNVSAAFTKSNVDLSSVRVYTDTAPGLTTLFGARRNCTPFSDGDFVTDTATVPLGMREAYKGESQFNFSASTQLAQCYAAASGAPRNHLRIDDPRIAKLGVDLLVCSQFKEQRTFCSFTAFYEGLSLGVGTTVQPQKLYPGDIITVDIPELGLIEQRMYVMSPGHYPDAKKIELIGWF